VINDVDKGEDIVLKNISCFYVAKQGRSFKVTVCGIVEINTVSVKESIGSKFVLLSSPINAYIEGDIKIEEVEYEGVDEEVIVIPLWAIQRIEFEVREKDIDGLEELCKAIKGKEMIDFKMG